MNKEEIQTCFSKLLEEEATMNKALEDAGWIRSVDPSLHWLRADTRLGLVMFYKAGNPPTTTVHGAEDTSSRQLTIAKMISNGIALTLIQIKLLTD